MACAGAARAQTAAKLVSNTGQSNSAGSSAAFNTDSAQAFSTGSHSSGYRLTRVDVVGHNTGATPPTYSVSIHSDSSGSPGTSVGTLTNPTSLPTTDQTLTYSAPAGGIALSANTTYFVVIDVSSGTTSTRFTATDSDSEDSGSESGWGIADNILWRLNHTTGSWTTDPAAMKIAVYGHEVPPMVSNTGVTGTRNDGDFTLDRAQKFATGGGAGGYKLTHLELKLKSSATTAPVYTVSIQGDSASSLPDGTNVGTLTNSSTLTASYQQLGFAASGDGISLAANTSYWVVIDVSTGNASSDIAVKNSTGEDPGQLPGWGIADASHFRNLNNTGSWSTAIGVSPFELEIHGSAVDQTAPAFQSATVSGSSLSVTFNENLVSGSLPAGSALTVSGGRSGTGTAAISGATVSVTLGSAVPFGETVTVSYSPPAASKLRDNAGNLAESFSDQPVANNTPPPVTPPPVTPPPVTPPPPPPVTPPPPPDSGTPGGTEQVPRDPEPLQLALWTDKPGYRAGETVRLYHALEPHDDDGRYRTFVYLEKAGGGERRYLAPLSAAGELHPEPVDRYGLPADVASARTLAAADRALAFEGEAPGPGLWQFVLELRPGAPREPFEQSERTLGTRRAWAKFRVAERSVLLNRRGFDREIRSDLTLRSDTLYYMGHQLFVHAGATLTIEPGTLVLASGRHAAIIVEPGGRIVAAGTRQAPVVLTCSTPVGWREPGCWGGLRILGRAPVTRLEGVAPGVLPAERPVYGGSEAETSSGTLSYVRVEFAGAGGDPDDPETALPAIGLYGAGSGTVLDHVQARASLGDGFAFRGGTAACERCVASGSGGAGLSWERGWRGGASHLYVQHGSGGLVGLAGGNDEQGHDREPRSLPTLSNVTLVHSSPFGSSGRTAVAVSLFSGSGVSVLDLLATGFRGGGIKAGGRSALLFGEGESAVSGALLYKAGFRPLRGVPRDAVEVISEDPRLRDVREFPNPDPRPKADSPALWELPPLDRLPAPGRNYIGAFDDRENWLEEWTVFGPESVYDLRQREEDEN